MIILEIILLFLFFCCANAMLKNDAPTLTQETGFLALHPDTIRCISRHLNEKELGRLYCSNSKIKKALESEPKDAINECLLKKTAEFCSLLGQTYFEKAFQTSKTDSVYSLYKFPDFDDTYKDVQKQGGFKYFLQKTGERQATYSKLFKNIKFVENFELDMCDKNRFSFSKGYPKKLSYIISNQWRTDMFGANPYTAVCIDPTECGLVLFDQNLCDLNDLFVK